MASNLTGTKWADHLRGCAGMANEIADILGLRDDAARQATFATVTIDAGKHGVFLEPIPEEGNRVISAIDPYQRQKETELPPTVAQAPPQRATPPRGEVVGKNLGALRDPTPEQAENANRGALLAGINSARELLEKGDRQWTPAYLNEYIAGRFQASGKTQLGTLDVDELAELTKLLSGELDAQKAGF